MLLPISQLLNPDDINTCQQLLADAPWLDGSLSAGDQAKQVKSNLQIDDQSQRAQQLRQIVLSRLTTDALFISAALPANIYPPKFNCYQDSGHYGLHSDSSIMTLPDGAYLRTDLSATLFLSDSAEYEGGELVIETEYGAQSVKLEAGDLILYPSNSLHQVTPVTRGKRLAAFFWVQSMVRNSFYREQLFELDQSIQQLTIDRGNTDQEVRRLSGLYHNLLREWAEV